MNTKECRRCKYPLPISQFSKASRESDGLQDRCKKCNKEVSAEYRAANVEKEKLRHKKYDQENRAERNEYLKKWQKENKDKVKKYTNDFYIKNIKKEHERGKKYYYENQEEEKRKAKEWRLKNLEYARLYDSIYAQENKNKINAKQAKRRALKHNATVSWRNNAKILAIYMECAELTKATGIKHHVDHIIPLISKEVCGLHWEANLQILTAHENLTKHNKLLI